MNLIADLKRRKVFKVGVAYLVVGWVLIQVAATVGPQLELPDWAPRLITVTVALGFPIALVLSWIFDIGPGGLRREAAFDGPASSATAGAMAPQIASAAETASAIPRKSIAVLPFADLSPTHDQEYFSDGIAEEILNALMKLKDLKVAGRTSSFSFRGRNEDLRGIGKTLSVAHVLEGSVRKHGDKVRITAQLIQTGDGYHLWSESYDGELSDVFELQERIARAITRELDVILHDGCRLVPVATSSPEAYALYLQATDIFNRRDGNRFFEAIDMLHQAIALDPRFARAHARLTVIHALEPIYTPNLVDGVAEKVRSHAALASGLDASLGEPYAAIAMMCLQQRRLIESREAIEHALALQPDDSPTRYWAGAITIATGYTKLGCAHLDHVLAIDPLYPIALLWRGQQYANMGDMDRAEVMLQHSVDTGLMHAWLGMHEVTAARGRIPEAVAQLTRALIVLGASLPDGAPAVLAQGVYGDAEARNRAFALMDRFVASQPRLMPGAIPYVLLLLGDGPRALDLRLHYRSTNDVMFFHRLWIPALKPLRQSPEFRAFAREIGLTALWDRYGPPDGARRDASGEYVWD